MDFTGLLKGKGQNIQDRRALETLARNTDYHALLRGQQLRTDFEYTVTIETKLTDKELAESYFDIAKRVANIHEGISRNGKLMPVVQARDLLKAVHELVSERHRQIVAAHLAGFINSFTEEKELLFYTAAVFLAYANAVISPSEDNRDLFVWLIYSLPDDEIVKNDAFTKKTNMPKLLTNLANLVGYEAFERTARCYFGFSKSD